MSNHYKGVGLRMGLDSSWKIIDQLSFYGKGTVSLLYSTFSVLTKESQSSLSSPSFIEISAVQFSKHQISAMLDLSAGIEWSYLFCNNRAALHLSVGWEFNDFFGQNKFSNPIFTQIINGPNIGSSLVSLEKNEDLTTQGLVTSARLDF